MRSLLLSLRSIEHHADYVVAIITQTKGSTYQKTGAMMLMDSQQHYWGLLSGGCLESDLLLRGQEVLNTKMDQVAVYNMQNDEDKLWGMGLGCDGEVNILLKYLPAEENHYQFFNVLESVNSGNNWQLSINNNQFNFEQSKTNRKHPTSHSPSDNIIYLNAPHHVLICGGSPDVPPVTAIANQVGWKTTVIDHRKNYADKNKFPFADNVIHLKRSQWQDFSLSQFDSAIVMSHQFERDQEYLSKLLQSSLKYLGVLGPTERRDRLLSNCETNFNQHKNRIFAPIGLDIGAATPETIALAIISEIQAVISGKSAIFCYQDSTR